GASGYAVRKGKQLLPTKEGIALISVLPEELKSAALTAEWENELLRMERGKLPVKHLWRTLRNLSRN
ncbi:DNA topoisomerase, partial [Mediterraneibacter gnavus]